MSTKIGKNNHCMKPYSKTNVNPDVYQIGIKTFIKNDNFHKLFKFITLYVQRFYSDAHLQK